MALPPPPTPQAPPPQPVHPLSPHGEKEEGCFVVPAKQSSELGRIKGVPPPFSPAAAAVGTLPCVARDRQRETESSSFFHSIFEITPTDYMFLVWQLPYLSYYSQILVGGGPPQLFLRSCTECVGPLKRQTLKCSRYISPCTLHSATRCWAHPFFLTLLPLLNPPFPLAPNLAVQPS